MDRRQPDGPRWRPRPPRWRVDDAECREIYEDLVREYGAPFLAGWIEGREAPHVFGRYRNAPGRRYLAIVACFTCRRVADVWSPAEAEAEASGHTAATCPAVLAGISTSTW